MVVEWTITALLTTDETLTFRLGELGVRGHDKMWGWELVMGNEELEGGGGSQRTVVEQKEREWWPIYPCVSARGIKQGDRLLLYRAE